MKKVLAEWEKGSTFAPAFGREAGLNGGDTEAKFFESLRPAQDRRRGMRRQGQEPLKKEHQEDIEAEPEIQNRQKETTIVQRRV